jgi:hypothetical protein
MQNSWCTEEGRDGGSAAKRWTQSQNRGSTSDQMVTPSSAHPDEMKTPDPNLLIDIDFDPPCVVNDKREVGERRPRDTLPLFPLPTPPFPLMSSLPFLTGFGGITPEKLFKPQTLASNFWRIPDAKYCRLIN